MNDRQAWNIIGSNLRTLVSVMVTVQMDAQVDVLKDGGAEWGWEFKLGGGWVRPQRG